MNVKAAVEDIRLFFPRSVIFFRIPAYEGRLRLVQVKNANVTWAEPAFGLVVAGERDYLTSKQVADKKNR